jgi:trans-aconitate methyltransferase
MKEINFMFDFLKEENELFILDVECGDGYFLKMIDENWPNKNCKINLKAIDKEEDEDLEDNINLNIFEKINAMEFLEKLEVKQNLIIFSNILHFYPYGDVKSFLQIALNKLKRNGIIFIKIANEHHGSKDIKYRFNESLIEQLNSFSKVEKYASEGHHYHIVITHLKK